MTRHALVGARAREDASRPHGIEHGSMTHVVNPVGAQAGDRGVLDYTTMRVGTVIQRWRGRVVERVARCSECGRNGARREHAASRTPGGFPSRPFITYTHRVRRTGLFVRAYDHCLAVDESASLRQHAFTSAPQHITHGRI